MSNQEFDNENTGSIFANKDKQKLAKERDTSNWPNGQGKLNVYGIEFYISSWIREIKKGKMSGSKFSSISIKPVDENQGKRLKKLIESELLGKSSSSKKSEAPENFDDADDDLPF